MEQHGNKRRHSMDASTITDLPRHGRRVSFCDIDEKTKPRNRRHSMMILPQGDNRRNSMEHGQHRHNSRRFSMQPLHELSLTTFSGLPVAQKPVVMVENTYQLEPDADTAFKSHIVRREVEQVMKRVLSESSYMSQSSKKYNKGNKFNHFQNKTSGGELAKKLTTQVKGRLKTLKMERYKLVVNSFVGDNCGQGLVIASRSLWNTDTDSHVTVVEKNATKYAVVVVHGVYYE